METAEIQQLRAGTRGTKERIYFNNAGSSLPPDEVLETITRYLEEEAAFGGYETEARYNQQLEKVYSSIARLINADPAEIALVENASTAWGLAFNGISFEKGDMIITSEMEYVTNLIGFLNVRKRKDIEIKVIPNDEWGNFQLAALEGAITPRTKLIAITHIPSATGSVLPVVEIGKIARKYGILYLVDACQSAGQVPLDVKEINCDMMSVTGRKYLRGPRGTGFLYVRKEIQDGLQLFFMDGHSTEWVSEDDYKIREDARRFELYEKNRALTLGLGVAIDYALSIGVDRIWQRVRLLAGKLRGALAAVPGLILHDPGEEKCGIVTFTIEGLDSGWIKDQLEKKKINVTVSRAGSTLFYMNKNHLSSVVRASVHYYNTEDEIEVLHQALIELSPTHPDDPGKDV